MFVAQRQWKGQKAVTPVINSLYFMYLVIAKARALMKKDGEKGNYILHLTPGLISQLKKTVLNIVFQKPRL